MIRWATRLYPSAWRRRYQDEFEVLLDQTKPGWPELFDVIKGAIKMQIHLPPRPAKLVVAAVAGVLAGMTAGLLLSPPRYVSTAALGFEKALHERDRGTGQIHQLADSARRRDFRISRDLYIRAAGRDSQTILTAVDAIGISYAAADPNRAQGAVGELVATLVSANSAVHPPIQIVQAPSIPKSATRLNVTRNVQNGALCGLAAGLLIGAAMLLRRQTPSDA